LVAILDADKEGFLRSETSLIQTIGRAARNANGQVIMYADTITPSMRRAIDETERRRKLQEDFNRAHGIVPRTIVKNVHDVIEISSEGGGKTPRTGKRLTKTERTAEIARLTRQMKEAAKLLEFELAAELRDQIRALEDGADKSKPFPRRKND
ncbi:MAG: UvrB/UvrC motif-containing protein, partial [Clostridiales bacterium]|nr:UvrB/UvrC motif-containing protein [Clostridiales bacterium]